MNSSIRRSRRLHDAILTVAHRACDDGQLDVAAKLLQLSEQVVAAEPDLRRRQQGIWVLIAAHERLWHLRNNKTENQL